jgi:dipeptidase E
MRALLLSNSQNPNTPYLSHALHVIERVSAGEELCFLPYALADADAYEARVAAALSLPVSSLHRAADPKEVLAGSKVVFVGGGNTFRLLATLQRLDLLDQLREQVLDGHTTYIGASAGTNIACPSIRTTNDMPIVETAGLTALGLVPFQINPHFEDTPRVGSSETRSERIAQFHEHSSAPVLGLEEGSWVEVSGRSVTLRNGAAVLFERGFSHRLVQDSDLSYLAKLPSRFDDVPPV